MGATVYPEMIPSASMRFTLFLMVLTDTLYLSARDEKEILQSADSSKRSALSNSSTQSPGSKSLKGQSANTEILLKRGVTVLTVLSGQCLLYLILMVVSQRN